jgi:hypothetical protein
MIDLKKVKPLLIGAGILGLGYFAIKYMQANASTSDDSVPASTENSGTSFSLPTVPDASSDVSTYPTIGTAAPISVNNTPTYLTYNYGNPSTVAQSDTYNPNDATAGSDSCCSDCADGCDGASTNNNPVTLINSIPQSSVDAQVANAFSANIGAPANYLTEYNPTSPDTYQGVLGNGATNNVTTNHIMNTYVQESVAE